jgi:predicted RecA/RadA family phage recombinase
VTYGNGLFVAVAASGTGDRVMTSPDGITWTSRTSAADNSWTSVTYGNGLFVAVSGTGTGDRVMTSPDGITWTSRTNATDNNWTSVTYGNGLFVATSVTGTGDRVMTSPDGITWTSRTSAADNSWYGITYGNGLFVAVSSNGSGNRVMTSGSQIENVIPQPSTQLISWGKTWQAAEFPQDWKESVWTNVGSNRPTLDYDQLNVGVWRCDYATAEGLGIFVTPRIPAGVTNLVFTIDAQAQTPGASGTNMGWKADIVRYRAGTAQSSIETVTLGSTALQTTGITQASYSVAVSSLTNSVIAGDTLAFIIYPNTAVSTPKQTDWMVLSISIGAN